VEVQTEGKYEATCDELEETKTEDESNQGERNQSCVGDLKSCSDDVDIQRKHSDAKIKRQQTGPSVTAEEGLEGHEKESTCEQVENLETRSLEEERSCSVESVHSRELSPKECDSEEDQPSKESEILFNEYLSRMILDEAKHEALKERESSNVEYSSDPESSYKR